MTAAQTPTSPLQRGDVAVVLGLGIASKAVVTALVNRHITVHIVEDRPTPATTEFAQRHHCVLHEAPTPDDLPVIFAGADAFIPSPGIPESHDAFAVAAATGTAVLSEFDLARWWDDRPIVAITGTDGKTSVTLQTVAMLVASGIRAVAVGNTDIPLIAAIDDPDIDVFVVEASSFRLGHSERFAPQAAAWLNFSPDHLDVHATLEGYEQAKAKIWMALPADGVAVAPATDPVVQRHLPAGVKTVIVGLEASPGTNAYVDEGTMVVDGTAIGSVDDLPRSFDHDITNTMVAAALALAVGATPQAIAEAAKDYRLPPHRIQHVATDNGIAYYNDSKATVPHAVITAARSFDSIVLIAGGSNKGLDLGELASVSDRTRGVIAIGDAASDIAAAFADRVPVEFATDMDDAVERASALAQPGDTVLLSPGCASFDRYANYGARGDDFIRAVTQRVGAQ